jgi:hypothetical protein
METSLNKLNSAIEQKLSKLTKTVSTKELGEIHLFVKEAKGLLDTLTSICEGPAEENELRLDCEFEGSTNESDDIFEDTLVRACHLIKGMYALLDDNRIKETQAKWIFDEAREFMDVTQELYGPRIPSLPNMRLVSKAKQAKQAS